MGHGEGDPLLGSAGPVPGISARSLEANLRREIAEREEDGAFDERQVLGMFAAVNDPVRLARPEDVARGA